LIGGKDSTILKKIYGKLYVGYDVGDRLYTRKVYSLY